MTGVQTCALPISGKRVRIAPAEAGFALRIAGVAGAIVISDADFTALAGTESATSSIAAFVDASPAVTLRRVTLTSQSGGKGKDGAGGAPGRLVSSTPGAATLNGNVMTADRKGGAAQTCTCSTGTTSTGGRGATIFPGGGEAATAGQPVQAVPAPAGANGAAGVMNSFGLSTPPTPPNRGSDALAGTSGVQGARQGDIVATGFQPSRGGDGTDGRPGQGGGGGQAYASNPSQRQAMFGGGGRGVRRLRRSQGPRR